jgi:hypothetical protein
LAAFIKSLSRFLGGSSKEQPAVHLSAFGKHPGWNDHIDDQGLDTDALINAKRLLYVQGISQNIDAGAWDKLEPQDHGAPVSAVTSLENFRHYFMWQMPVNDSTTLLAGRLWSSTDGKGRAKYPMVLCSQLTELPPRFATQIVLPFLSEVHEKCVAAKTASTVTQIISTERDVLRSHMKDPLPLNPLLASQLVAVARHPEMTTGDAGVASGEGGTAGVGGGFHRIVYQFVKGMSIYRPVTAAVSRSMSIRPEQVRVPTCGMAPAEALLFWLRFALTLLDKHTSILLFAPDQPGAPWVDLIVGEPSPNNLFCIKAGPKNIPFTSNIPYTLDPSLVQVIDAHIAHCASVPDNVPLPPWPAM